jgi:hypothetical protein
MLLKTNEACRNEAKKYMKTKDLFKNNGTDACMYMKINYIAMLKVADLAVLVRRNVQIGAQNQQKSLVSRKTKRNFRVAW